jgi:hypothetical protein
VGELGPLVQVCRQPAGRSPGPPTDRTGARQGLGWAAHARIMHHSTKRRFGAAACRLQHALPRSHDGPYGGRHALHGARSLTSVTRTRAGAAAALRWRRAQSLHRSQGGSLTDPGVDLGGPSREMISALDKGRPKPRPTLQNAADRGLCDIAPNAQSGVAAKGIVHRTQVYVRHLPTWRHAPR